MNFSVKIILLWLLVVITPIVGLNFYDRYVGQELRQRVVEDREECLKSLGDNVSLKPICFSASSQAEEAYRSAMDSVKTTRNLQFGIICVLAFGLVQLSRRVGEMNKKDA